MKLSQRRADSVMKYLVKKGVSADRLVAEGFGPNRPIVPDATSAEDLAQNRRVEFHITDMEGAKIIKQNSGPTEDTID
ncbi:MAG: OmpA family protein [Polyangiales bacterium]